VGFWVKFYPTFTNVLTFTQFPLNPPDHPNSLDRYQTTLRIQVTTRPTMQQPQQQPQGTAAGTASGTAAASASPPHSTVAQPLQAQSQKKRFVLVQNNTASQAPPRTGTAATATASSSSSTSTSNSNDVIMIDIDSEPSQDKPAS